MISELKRWEESRKAMQSIIKQPTKMETKQENKDKSTETQAPEIGVPQMPQDAPAPAQVSESGPEAVQAATTPQVSPDFGGLKPDDGKQKRNVRSLDELGKVGFLIKSLREKKVVGLNLTSLRDFSVSLIFPAYTIEDPTSQDNGSFDMARFKNDFEAYQDTQKLDIQPIKIPDFDTD